MEKDFLTLLADWRYGAYAYTLFLTLCRCGSTLALLPGFGEALLPARVRLFTAFVLSAAIQPIVAPGLLQIPPVDLLLTHVAGEVLAGSLIGIWGRVLFQSLTIGAGFCAQVLGITNIFDATLEPGGAPALSGYFSFTALALMFATGGHFVFLKALVDSYTLIPLIEFPDFGDSAQSIIDAGVAAFSFGLRLASPFLAVGFLINAGLGLINRAMPQIPVFLVGQPLMIVAGFFLIALTLPSALLFWSESVQAFFTQRLG